jgi:DNA-binding NtrC family response regulator
VKAKTSAIKGSKILIVDDHRNIRVSLRMTLESEGATVVEASTLSAAKTALNLTDGSIDPTVDLILLDIRLPDGNGLDFLSQLGKHEKSNRVIVISGEGTAVEAFRATEIGAFDFIEKPFTPERVLVSATRCIEFHRIESANADLSKARSAQEIVGEHAKIKDVISIVDKVAPTNGRVLITGESGTGKELIAREIHRRSSRSRRTMIKVNCAAIPKNLMESELFGHEKGAFTGAIKTRLGVFERADNGTLFLDEIGELDLDLQAKLLRVLQNGEFSRVGGEKTIKTDVRVICATNRDLKQMCQTGEFREDLFYRLNVVTIHSPALRDRSTDIPELSRRFLHECCQEHSLGQKELSEFALKQLESYTWPGNVRELRNVIERTAIFSSDPVIDHIDDIDNASAVERPVTVHENSLLDPNTDSVTLCLKSQSWERFQETAGREFLIFMLAKSNGNVSEAARSLDLERAYLHRLMKKLSINRN